MLFPMAQGYQKIKLRCISNMPNNYYHHLTAKINSNTNAWASATTILATAASSSKFLRYDTTYTNIIYFIIIAIRRRRRRHHMAPAYACRHERLRIEIYIDEYESFRKLLVIFSINIIAFASYCFHTKWIAFLRTSSDITQLPIILRECIFHISPFLLSYIASQIIRAKLIR